MSTAPLGSAENPIRPDNKQLHVQIDVLGARSPVEALAQVLMHEPYYEALCYHFSNRTPSLHIRCNGNFDIDFEKILSGRKFNNITVSATEDPGSIDLTEQINKGFALPPFRQTPCPGYQDWLKPVKRPKSIHFMLHNFEPLHKKLTEFKTKLEDQVSLSCLTLPDLCGSNLLHLISQMKEADMVCTDDVACAAIALAFGVRRVTCLGLYGDAELYLDLRHNPDVKLFRRLNSSEADQYEAFFKFAEYEWEHYERYPAFLNQGNAKAFIESEALLYCRGYGLDVGSNHWPLPGALASDLNSRKFDRGPFDFIFSSHCLEHIEDWRAELKLWKDSLKTDGIMFIYVPHPLMEMWLPEGPWVRGGWHKWSPDPVALFEHLSSHLDMEIIRYSSRPDAAWGFSVVAKKLR